MNKHNANPGKRGILPRKLEKSNEINKKRTKSAMLGRVPKKIQKSKDSLKMQGKKVGKVDTTPKQRMAMFRKMVQNVK